MQEQTGYIRPRIETLPASAIVEALGPVSAGSGGPQPCQPTGWMGGCP